MQREPAINGIRMDAKKIRQASLERAAGESGEYPGSKEWDHENAFHGDFVISTVVSVFRIAISTGACECEDCTINGAAQNGNAYLGVSFYPNGCRDSLKEGRFDCRQVQSIFSEIWTIPDKFKGGRYDIALWNNKINKNECTLKSCVWCKKLGYHLWWLLFLKSGVIEAHRR